LILIISLSFNAQAEKSSGRDFLLFCDSPRFEAKINCSMYVTGVLVGYSIANPSKPNPFCVPDAATNDQLTAVASKYLVQHPELHHRNFGSIVIQSMMEAFPCR
jgi:hypothetical protein